MCLNDRWTSANISIIYKLFINLYRAVIGPSSTQTGRGRPAKDLCRMLAGKQGRSNLITRTCLYNFDPLKPHFCIVKLGFTGVNIIFLIFAQNIDCGYSLKTPRRELMDVDALCFCDRMSGNASKSAMADLIIFCICLKAHNTEKKVHSHFGLNNILFQCVETFAFKYIDRIQWHNHTGFENKHIMLLLIISCNNVTL